MMWNKNQILRCSELIRQSDEITNTKKLAQLYTRENWRRQTCLPAYLFRIYTHTQVRETTCSCDVSSPTRPDCCCCCYLHHHDLLRRKFLFTPQKKSHFLVDFTSRGGPLITKLFHRFEASQSRHESITMIRLEFTSKGLEMDSKF
jgi:hypothetical protein